MKSQKRSKRIYKILLYIGLIAAAMVYILPILLVVFSAFKVNRLELTAHLSNFNAFLPKGQLGLQNFIDVFTRINLGHFFMNSVIITSSTVLLGLIVNSALGYSLARLPLKGKNLILLLVISIMIIPGESVVVPLLAMVTKMGLVESYIVQIIPFIADAFYIFLFTQAFKNLPKELEEAALIDGADYLKIFYKIILPVSKPTVVTVAILSSIGRWGDVLWPTMVTRSAEYRPLALGVLQLFSVQPQNWGNIFASAVVMTIPILILFLIFQKHFVNSMASSGIKG
jgi:multiple sugar transport system permease protein